MCINALNILKSNKIGSRVIDSYKITKNLTEEQRSMVINIIARYFDENIPEEGGQIIAQSLFHDNLSADEHESAWCACSNYRLQQIFKRGNLCEIFKICPQYKNPNGFKFIDKDFAFIYESHDSILSWGSEKMMKLYNFEKINNFFIYLNGSLLPISNFLRSLDLYFKIFHLFNLEYPKACESVWSFIEIYFYALNSRCKKNNPKVSIILEDLKENDN
ncbi:uncharacterized protein LOC124420983 [Lucilia cuprina]|uniref:uncharacterized protein LOC124420983 n=1 Tax=Lucilia cuprina TaxID=7375 RepID=UPI001F052452|nr:uncharacterized protein LOC124420983 [Lucilia cuprina]